MITLNNGYKVPEQLLIPVVVCFYSYVKGEPDDALCRLVVDCAKPEYEILRYWPFSRIQ